MKKLIMTVWTCLAAGAWALDESTMALYLFNDGAAGTSASGLSLTNSVDGTAFAGAVNVTAGGSLVFSDDVPGTHLLDGVDGVTVGVNPQSIDFSGSSANEGAGVTFAGVMDELVTTNAFTLEFFYKKPTSLAGNDPTSSQLLTFKMNATYTALVTAPYYTGSNELGVKINGSRTVTFDDVMQDGKWHHVAICGEKKPTDGGSTYLVFDYTNIAKSVNSRTGVVYTDMPGWFDDTTTGPVTFGGGTKNLFRGLVAGVRITKGRKLTGDQMLKASDSPIYNPGDDDQPIPAVTPRERTSSMGNWWEIRHTNVLEQIAAEGPSIKTAFLGDSLTDNWNKEIWDASFPPYGPINLGFTADYTDHVLWRIANGEMDGFTAKVVVLLIGTNNRGTGTRTPTEPVKHTVRGIKAVIDAVQEKQPMAKILLHAIFPRGDLDSEGIRKLRLVNDGIKEFADGTKVIWCDFYDKFLNPDGSQNTALFNADTLHLNKAGYTVWRDNLLPVLAEAFYEPISVKTTFRPGTVAFYAFNSGLPGQCLTNAPVQNTADVTRYAGTADITETAGYEATGRCEISGNGPGKYVFDGVAFGSEPIVTNPRSVRFDGQNGNLSKNCAIYSGGRICFDGLATTLLASDEYTVEFFYRIPAGITEFSWFNTTVEWGNPDDTSGTRSRGLILPNHVKGDHTMRRVAIAGSTSSGKYYDYPARLSDGQWHHVAVVRSKDSKGACVASLYCDYVNVSNGCKDAKVAAPPTLPLILSRDYRLRGCVSCLRVTTNALTTAQMLSASETTNIVGKTLFHWTMEGEPEATATVVTNVSGLSVQDFGGQYITNYLVGAGFGAAEDVARPLVFSRGRPRGGCVVSASGEDIHTNVTAGSLPYEGGAFRSLRVPASSMVPVVSGSFTFETFFRFADKAAWDAHRGSGSSLCSLAYRPSDAVPNRAFDWWCGLKGFGSGALRAVVSTGRTSAGDVAIETATSVPFDGRWHHYAFVYDDEKLTITQYLDYQPAGSATLDAPILRTGASGGDYLYIGKGAGSPFEGSIDEVRYSSVALQPQEFLTLTDSLGLLFIVR